VADCPLRANTPMIWKGVFWMRTDWPVGSALDPKSLSTTVCPNNNTLLPASMSA